MENSVETLSILAEVTIAFVAFSTIVASIKLSIGGSLSPYQKLLIHYFTESSMLSLSIALLTLVLLDFFPGREEFVAGIACAYSFITTGIYLVWYLHRRSKVDAPASVITFTIIIGYILLIVLLGIFSLIKSITDRSEVAQSRVQRLHYSTVAKKCKSESRSSINKMRLRKSV